MGRHRTPTRTALILRTAGATAALTGAAAAVLPGAALASTVDWGPIAACESGGNPVAQNPTSTASGLLQFLDTSWAAYGGGQFSARAKDATPAQQLQIADRAYAQSGLTPWEASRACWQGQVGTHATTPATNPAPVAAPRIAAHHPHVTPPVTAPVTVALADSPDATPTPVAPTGPPPAGRHASGHEAPRHAVTGTPRHARVTVQSGDTLSGIAAVHGETWQQVYAANRAVIGANANLIYPGQILNV